MKYINFILYVIDWKLICLAVSTYLIYVIFRLLKTKLDDINNISILIKKININMFELLDENKKVNNFIKQNIDNILKYEKAIFQIVKSDLEKRNGTQLINSSAKQVSTITFPIYVKENGILHRSAIRGYFYIEKNDKKYKLHIENEILNSKAGPGYDDLFRPFFQIIISDSNIHDKYEFIEPATVEWDEDKNIGRVVQKGKIRR